MKLLLVDNYDSFTYNLYDYLSQLGVEVIVSRNDALTLEEIVLLDPQAIVLSPGPGRPSEAGVMMDLIAHFYDKKPILGICLGHQGIGEFFGAKLVKADLPMHGKTSMIHHNGHEIYQGLPPKMEVMRYHSLILKDLEETGLTVTAKTEAGEIMAISHNEFPLVGIQYHPESVLTEYGFEVLENWVKTIQEKGCLNSVENELTYEHR